LRKIFWRLKQEKVKRLRLDGIIPAEIFGRDFANQHLSVSEKEFVRVFKEAGKSTIINLEINAKEKVSVLIKHTQNHPITGKTLSVDFYRIKADEKIQTRIPIEFTGTAPVEKQGFLIVKVMNELEIEALPQDIPREIKVDLVSLGGKEDKVHVKNLNVPKNVKVLTPSETVVAIVSAGGEEEEKAPVVTPEKIKEDEKNKEEASTEEKKPNTE